MTKVKLGKFCAKIGSGNMEIERSFKKVAGGWK
jgi:hypothetical protein